jgi:hypothetical protein
VLTSDEFEAGSELTELYRFVEYLDGNGDHQVDQFESGPRRTAAGSILPGGRSCSRFCELPDVEVGAR